MASLLQAQDYHNAGRYDDAIHELMALLKEDSESAKARLQLAASQLAKASAKRKHSPPLQDAEPVR